MGALQVVIDFWKYKPQALEQSIQEWVADGLSEITTFVPWSLLESDVTHQLYRFALCVVESGLRLNLIVTPEVGLDLPNSGLPKEWGGAGSVSTRSAAGRPIPVVMGPNAYALPSLLDAEVSRRYQNYLKKLDSLLGDLYRANPECAHWIELWVGSSFFSLYDRNCSVATGTQASGEIEAWLNAGEFARETEEIKAKMRERHSDYLRGTFISSQCDQFRHKTTLALNKKKLGFKFRQLRTITPEALPVLQPLQALSAMDPYAVGESVALERFLEVVDQETKNLESVGNQLVPPVLHWTGLGIFHRLSDSEKQHLLLRSILKAAPLGGGVLVSWSEWRGLSKGFKNRIRSLGVMASQGELTDSVDVVYWTAAHGGSELCEYAEEIKAKIPEQCAWINEPSRAQVRRDAKLLIVDSSCLIGKSHIDELLSFAQGGRVVAIPAPNDLKNSMSVLAKRLLIEKLKSAACVSLNHGCALQVFAFGAGEVVLYDSPKESADPLFASLFNLAKISCLSSTSDIRLELLYLKKSQSESNYAVFIMNRTSAAVSGDLRFTADVSISDLAFGHTPHPENTGDGTAWAKKFALDVPPYGILPVEVNFNKPSEIGLKQTSGIAVAALPGLDPIATELGGSA